MDERGRAVGFVERRETEGPIPPEAEEGAAETAGDEAADAEPEPEAAEAERAEVETAEDEAAAAAFTWRAL
jgi:hypothetical protein